MWYFDLLSSGFEKYISHEEANYIWLHSGVNFVVIVSLSQKAIIDQAMCLVIPWVRNNFLKIFIIQSSHQNFLPC